MKLPTICEWTNKTRLKLRIKSPNGHWVAWWKICKTSWPAREVGRLGWSREMEVVREMDVKLCLIGEIWALKEDVADGFGKVAATSVWRCFELESVLVNIEEGVSGKDLGYGIGKIHVRVSAARLWRWAECTSDAAFAGANPLFIRIIINLICPISG